MKKNKKRFLLALTYVIPVLILLLRANVSFAGLPSGWTPDANIAATNLPNTSIATIIFTFLQWLLLVFTFISVIGFIISGIMFITAGGSDRVNDAKKWLTYSIIGVAVGLLGYVINAFVDQTLSGLVQEQG